MTDRCSFCGAERPDDATFCGNCGEKFDAAPPREVGESTSGRGVPVWTWLLAVCAGLASLVAVVVVVLVVGSDDEPVASEILLEPSTETGTEPFTPSVDTLVSNDEPVAAEAGPAAREPQVDLAAEEAPEVQAVSGAEPGLFAASTTESACDGQSLVAHLEEDPERATAWAGVIGIEPSTIPDYVAKLTPLALTRDTRVTNHSFEDGRAHPFDSVFEAGTTVMVDDLGVPRVRCRCGNPLTEAEPVEGRVDYVGTAWSDFEPADTVSIAPAEAPVTEFAVDDLSGPPEVAARLPLGSVKDVAVGHGSVWAVTGTTLVRVSPATNEVEAEIPLGSEATQASVLTTEDAVLVSAGHFPRDMTPVWLDLLRVDPEANEVASTERLHLDEAGTQARGIQAPHLAAGEAGIWVVDTAKGTIDHVGEDGQVGKPIPGVSVSADEVTALAVTDSVWLGSGEGLELVAPEDGSVQTIALGADAVSSLSASDTDVWVAVADESDEHDTGLRLAAGTGELLRVDANGTVVDRFAVGDPPYALTASEDGLVWVATGPAFAVDGSGGGRSSLLRLDPSRRQVSQGADLGAVPNAVATTRDAVWVATEDGLVRAAPYSQAKVRAASAPLPPLEQVRTAPLTADGLGPIRAGMHVDELEAALGVDVQWDWDFTPEEYDGEGCGYARVPGLEDMGLDIMIGGSEPRVVRVEIWGPSSHDTTPVNPVTKTETGIGIGSTESDVFAAYGADRVDVQPSESGEGHYLSVGAPGGNLLLFETNGNTVMAMRGGLAEWVVLIEGCA